MFTARSDAVLACGAVLRVVSFPSSERETIRRKNLPISRVSTVIVCCVPSEGSAVSPLLRHGEAFHALHVFTRDVCAAQGRPRPSRHGGTLRPRSQTASDTNAARRLNVPGAKANKALGRRSELGWPQKQMTAGHFRLPRTHRAAAARRMGTASALGGGMRAGRATRDRSRPAA